MSEYRTIQAPAEAQLVERKSRFIGQIAPVSTEEEAFTFLENVRQRHREATHNCYAYLLREGQKSRFSDDGEPSGTAGRPILEVLRREGLVNVVLVVTRYFGGILLGAGGLVRAYAQSAGATVEAAAVRMMYPAVLVALTLSYDLYGKLTYILPKYQITIKDLHFEEVVSLLLLVHREQLAPFTREVEEFSAGRAVLQIERELYADFYGG